jgi:hypothetical protein
MPAGNPRTRLAHCLTTHIIDICTWRTDDVVSQVRSVPVKLIPKIDDLPQLLQSIKMEVE